jgi:O-antigen/teichoic acid export membrane protein
LWATVKSAEGFPRAMTKQAGPSTLEKASVIAAPVFNTLIFLLVASYLGVGELGSLALLLSLGAVLTMSFDVSFAWSGSGGRAARVTLHAASAGLGVAVAAVGLFVGLDWRIIPIGLYMVYHGASAMVIATADGQTAASAGLLDAAARMMLVFIVLFSDLSTDIQTWVATIYLIGGMLALGAVAGKLRGIDFSKWREELRGASGFALAYALFGSLLLWIDKPVLYYLSNSDTLGYYFAVQRVVIFIASAATVITGMVARQLSELPEDKSIRLATLMERYAFLCVLPMTVYYVVFAQPLVEVFFNKTFALHYELTYPMVIGGLAVAMASPAVAWLVARRRFVPLAAAAIAGAAITALAPLALCQMSESWFTEPSMAMSIGAMFGALAFYAISRWEVFRRGVSFHKRMAIHVLCSGVMAVVLYWLSEFFGKLDFFTLVVLSLVGVLVYGVVLYMTGEFLRTEYYEFEELRGI